MTDEDLRALLNKFNTNDVQELRTFINSDSPLENISMALIICHKRKEYLDAMQKYLDRIFDEYFDSDEQRTRARLILAESMKEPRNCR